MYSGRCVLWISVWPFWNSTMPGTQSNSSVPAAGLKKKNSLQSDYITEALPCLTAEMWFFFFLVVSLTSSKPDIMLVYMSKQLGFTLISAWDCPTPPASLGMLRYIQYVITHKFWHPQHDSFSHAGEAQWSPALLSESLSAKSSPLVR